MKPRKDIPWRSRQNKTQPQNDPSVDRKHWFRKIFTVGRVVGGMIVVSIAWVLLNGITALENAEHLPTAYVKTRDSLLSWHYDDASWTGVWSNNPEGYTDSEDVTLSAVDVYLQIHTAQGTVDGTIATQELCRRLPFAMDGVLFKGKVSGNMVHGLAYDFIGGKRVNLAFVSILQDSEDPSILTVQVTDNANDAFPSQARIRRDFNKRPMDVKALGNPYCAPIRYPNSIKDTKKRRPIAELQHTLPPAPPP